MIKIITAYLQLEPKFFPICATAPRCLLVSGSAGSADTECRCALVFTTTMGEGET